jgi:hypothetical protein
MVFAAGSALLWLATATASEPFAKALAGKRLIMKDAACAGLAFRDKDRVELYAEMGCVDLEARLRWLGPDTFVLTETERINQDCPPRNWIYKVESLTGKNVRLREVWTGWNDFPDSVVEYRISTPRDKPEP